MTDRPQKSIMTETRCTPQGKLNARGITQVYLRRNNNIPNNRNDIGAAISNYCELQDLCGPARVRPKIDKFAARIITIPIVIMIWRSIRMREENIKYQFKERRRFDTHCIKHYYTAQFASRPNHVVTAGAEGWVDYSDLIIHRMVEFRLRVCNRRVR